MKILFHISSIYGGGAERVLCNLANHFCNNDNDVTIVVCYEKDNEYFIDEKINKIVLKEKNILAQSKELRKIIKEINPDISIGFMQGGNIRLTLASIFLKNKYILSVRNDPKREYPNIFSRLFAKTLFHLADGVVFQTEDAKKFFSKKIQKKSIVIFNPVDEDFFADDYNPNNKNVISIGRFTKQKNWKMLIHAFNAIKDDICDDLYIYGEGEEKEKIQNLVFDLELDDRVYIMNRTKDVKQVLSKSKCFVLTSNFEGMPNVLLESICMLLPTISTDCPCGGPRLILENDLDLLINCGDTLSLSRKIKNICNDVKYRKNISDKMKEYRKKFIPNKILMEWNEFLLLKINKGEKKC